MQVKLQFTTLSFILAASMTLSPLTAAISAPAAKAPEKAPAPAADKPADKAGADKEAKDKDAKDSKEAKDKDAKDDKKVVTRPEPVIENVVNVGAETLVDHPAEYLNKNIRFTAQFSGYNSLALDYKPAFKSAKNYLSFSVLRDHSKVPLSELKLAMINPKDEKDPFTKLLLKLKEKDEIEVTGKVFATALDEPWVEVLKIKLIKEAPDDKKKDDASTPAK